jgi:microcystin-dependent protein
MNPFLGQIQAFPFNFAPEGWLPCDGRLLDVTDNTALFVLLGTLYGGDGQTTFGIPKIAPIATRGPSYFIAIQGAFPQP